MKRETHTIDATGKVSGRLATQIAVLLRGKTYLAEGSQWLDEGQPERAMQMYLTVLLYGKEEQLHEIINMSSEMVDKNKGCTPAEKAMLLFKAAKEHMSKASYFCFIEKYSAACERLESAIKKYDAALQTGRLPFNLQKEAAEQIFFIENKLESILANQSPVVSCKDAKLYLN